MSNVIYFHFLDRELRKSINAKLSDVSVQSILAISFFMEHDIALSALSHTYESRLEFPNSMNDVDSMRVESTLGVLSSHRTEHEFLFTRQDLYKHSKEKYPMYFKKNLDTVGHLEIITLNGSTTEYLQDNLVERQTPKVLDKNGKKQLEKVISKSIDISRKKNIAVTYELFDKRISNSRISNREKRFFQDIIRKEITVNYLQRYLSATKSTIITGIPGLEYYDDQANSKVSTNLACYELILRTIGISKSIYSNWRNVKTFFDKDVRAFHELRLLLNSFLKAIEKHEYQKIFIFIKNNLNYAIKKGTVTPLDAMFNLHWFLNKLYVYYPEIRIEMEENMKTPKSIVLMGTNTTEMRALYASVDKYFPNNTLIDRNFEGWIVKELTGTLVPLFLVRTEMGGVGTSSTMNVTHKIIKLLNPQKIIMGGIGFGANQSKQKFGDVWISKQVWSYEPAKETEAGQIPRGDKVTASDSLLALFRHFEPEYKKTNLDFGLIASGEKLVDNKEFLNKLLSHEPELVGGDMEAFALASVCINNHVDWIVLKGISDWGFGKADGKQAFAATNSYEYILHCIVNGNLL